ncbi:PspA/IM30 family protein [Streptomyces niveus]|uniref:PspA/IM30 family protein n=1 Tax=Streptomyces niveus TaxID=193462 RepID=UPI0036C7DD3F
MPTGRSRSSTGTAETDVNDWLGQAEDSQKTIDRLIGDYTKAVAASMGNRGRLELDHQESVPAAREWGGEAKNLVGDRAEIEVRPVALKRA